MPNPRADAFARLGGLYEVRVLEPSPPGVADPPWFADDPTARGYVPPDRTLVSPVSSGDITWAELCDHDPDLSEWCADRWLGAWRRLGHVPDGLALTRRSLRNLAARVISPVRERAHGVVGLRWTRGGFGTPILGEGGQVRVEHGMLIVSTPDSERRAPITTLADAAHFIGFDRVELTASPLKVKEPAARFISDFLGFATLVLEELRAVSPPAYEPTRVELWPEWLDLQVEIGSEALGLRATCGASPGEPDHPEPYLYVVPQSVRPIGELWTPGFRGARLPYSDLLAAADQRGCAIDFFRSRIDALHHALRL